MKKKLLSLAFAAALLPAFNAYGATDPGLTQKWCTPFLEIGDWNGAAADWNSTDAIKNAPCARFATARGGKIYTVNMKTMSIAEVTSDGLNDLYKLDPSLGSQPMVNLADGTAVPQIYGTAISLDDAGNFLIGRNFVTPTSSLYWSVYSPTSKKTINLPALPVPDGWTIGRIDCVGRVLGDLTREALFFIAPTQGNYTQKVRVIKATGNGSVESITLEDIGEVAVLPSAAAQQGIVQPAFRTYADYEAAGEENYNFYYSATSGVNNSYTAYLNGTAVNNFAPDMQYSIKSGVNGFDTFVLGGKRYFVRNYSITATARDMGFAVLDENGDILTTYMNTDYVPDGGYSTLIAEPVDNESANIYIYNAQGKGVCGAMLEFRPADCNAPVIPEKPVGISPEDPYVINDPVGLATMGPQIQSDKFYVSLANDIDMAGTAFSPIKTTANIYIEGNNHVIKNLTAATSASGNYGLFDQFSGEVRNLGFENVYVSTNWGCGGALAGQTNDAVIENCYVTGSVTSAAAGGFVGTVAGNTLINNSYSIANVTDLNNHYAGGLVGRVGSQSASANLTVNNSYAGGNVSARGTAGGIACASFAESVIILNNVIAWNSSVTGNAASGALAGGLSENITLENCMVFKGMKLNGEPAGEATTDDLMAEVSKWEGFNKTVNNGRAVLAWQKANGNPNLPATKDNPLVITNADELVAMRNYMSVGDSYYSIENDIDMADVNYVAPLGDNNFSGCILHIEGNGHVIKNLTIDGGQYPSLIGVFMGEIRNLGLVDVDIVSDGPGVGSFGAFTGHASYDGVTVIDNCFATGNVTANNNYAGGIGGYNNGKVKITNCYSAVNVVGKTFAGGILGWVPSGETTIENVYASGYVEATDADGKAGGIINLVEEAVGTLNSVVAWNSAVYAADGATAAVINGGNVVATENNVVFCNALSLNGEEAPEGGKTSEELTALVTSWDAFCSKDGEDLPVLKWQAEGSAGIDDIVADEAEANGPAVYYNLQGVQVANPESGIYIVRRGNKVTKELIR